MADLQPFQWGVEHRALAMLRSAAEALAAARMRDPAGLSISINDNESLRYYGLINGIAIIPVQGVLGAGGGWWCDSTPYSWIEAGFDAALRDDSVKAIVLDTNSPGGAVEGCFDLVDKIYAGRGTKPIWAILGESAYSAAYAIASACDRITVPRTGGAGSIGIVSLHVDISRMLKAAGVKITFLQYGKKKTDGAQEKPLSDDARACFQSDVDLMGDLFVETVARNRQLDAATIKKTEAGTFMGEAAVAIGLCDEVLSPSAAFQMLQNSIA
jgi:signal peptide peptidase SppA